MADTEKAVSTGRLATFLEQIKQIFAKKEIYGDDCVSFGRKAGTGTGTNSVALGTLVEASGNYSKAEGYSTIARGHYSHAEGYGTTASGQYAHAEGYITSASSSPSHAEGDRTTASGGCSHAEGVATKASASGSHAEGYSTTASGSYSHAEGDSSFAQGYAAHAEGYHTIAYGSYSHVQGKYNVGDTSNTYAHILGNGTSVSTRSNAHTIDWDGNAWYAGDVENGSGVTMNGLQEEINELKSSGGSGGTSDYEELSNKPQIEGVELSGNKTLEDFGIVEMTYEETLAVLNETEEAA